MAQLKILSHLLYEYICYVMLWYGMVWYGMVWYVCMHACMYVCMCVVCVYVYVCVCMCMYVYVCMCMCMFMCIYIYICTYLCVCVCIYIRILHKYIYTTRVKQLQFQASARSTLGTHGCGCHERNRGPNFWMKLSCLEPLMTWNGGFFKWGTPNTMLVSILK